MFEHFEDRTATMSRIREAAGYNIETDPAIEVSDKNFTAVMEENCFYSMITRDQKVNKEYAEFYYTHFDMYEESPDPTADMNDEQKEKYEQAVAEMEASLIENHLENVFSQACLVFRTGDKIEYIKFKNDQTDDIKGIASLQIAGLEPIDAYHMAVM